MTAGPRISRVDGRIRTRMETIEANQPGETNSLEPVVDPVQAKQIEPAHLANGPNTLGGEA